MKKKSAIITSVALAGLLLAGGTFAYLQSQTEEAKNTFTMGEGLTGEIKEPNWDGVCFIGEEDCVAGPIGKEEAKDFTPGLEIPKDPQVKNTSENTPAYIAVKIAYTGTAEDSTVTSLADLNKFADVDWNTKDWDFNADYTVAYYKNAVNGGKKTSPVFNKVTIKKDATHPTGANANVETNMHNFEITLKGYLTQTTDIKKADGTVITNAKEALLEVFGSELN